jgi:hypothetical protein
MNRRRALFHEGNQTPSSREEHRGGWGGEKGPSRVDSPLLGPLSPPAGREGVMSCKTLGGRRARAGEEGGFLAPVSPQKTPVGARGGTDGLAGVDDGLSPHPHGRLRGSLSPPKSTPGSLTRGLLAERGCARAFVGPQTGLLGVFWGGPSPPLGSRGRTCLPSQAVLATINEVETPEVTPVAP